VSSDSCSDTLCEIVHVVGEVSLSTHRSHNGGSGIQIPGEHHVGRNEELEDGSEPLLA
jgi:hypothetical protein